MTDSPESQEMIGGYGSDDKVEMEAGGDDIGSASDANTKEIAGMESADGDQDAHSSTGNVLEEDGRDVTNEDNPTNSD